MTEKTARESLRDKIFTRREFKREEVELFGQKVEVKQPSLGSILNAQETPDRRKATVNLMIEYCYVPGTDEKVFEPADEQSLLDMPFDQSLVGVSNAISRLTGVDVMTQEKNSAGTQPDAES